MAGKLGDGSVGRTAVTSANDLVAPMACLSVDEKADQSALWMAGLSVPQWDGGWGWRWGLKMVCMKAAWTAAWTALRLASRWADQKAATKGAQLVAWKAYQWAGR